MLLIITFKAAKYTPETKNDKKVYYYLKADSRLRWPNVLEFIFPWKRKVFNFCFRSIFIFNKKEPQSCQFATYRRKALFDFLTSQTGQMAFQIFKVAMRLLCISLTH